MVIAMTILTATLLKPLTDLQLADELSGMARGIAFRLIENHGIIQRREIAADVKSLDQDGRAALRRYGVRFGFYHIFVPSLIKPAPAGLITLLWATANNGRNKPGFGDVVSALATGRTSVVTDEQFEPMYYKLAGYRVLGPRAVRVDILERLADLIRPCVYWKPGTAPLPDGAFGDSKFVVTPAMMSILGATAEDMEHVLKGLGYRHEAMDADAAGAAIKVLQAQNSPKPAAETAETNSESVILAPAASGESAQGAPQVTTDAETIGDAPDQPVTPPAQGSSVVDAGAADRETARLSDAKSAVSGDGNAQQTSQVEPAEAPKPVLIWRQAGFGDRNRGQRSRHAQGGGRAGPGRAADAGSKHSAGRGYGKGSGKDSDQGERKGGEGRKKGRGPRRDTRKNEAPGKTMARPPERKTADPDSPFAKLQALKEQMKK